MAFYGRHKVHVLFWPWGYNQFTTTTDIITCSITKSASSGQTARLSLFPRPVPYRERSDGTIQRDYNAGYMDALGPNDWVFIWVDPGDSDVPEPLFLGFIDRVAYSKETSDAGTEYAIDVSCTGFEKVFNNTLAITNPWLSENINMANLIALGPAGQSIDAEGLEGAPGVDLFTGLTPNVMGWLMRTFLNVQETPLAEDYNKQAEDLDALVRSLTSGDSSRSQLQTILGQFVLPRIGTPIWSFLKLRFQNVQERAYLDTEMFLSQTSIPLSRMIDNFSNQLLNELIYDVRRLSNPGTSDIDNDLVQEVTGGYSISAMNEFVNQAGSTNVALAGLVDDIAPHVIFRRRPLFTDELRNLDGPTLSEEDFASLDVGPSDADVRNLTLIDTPSLNANSPARINSGFAGFDQYSAECLYSIARHGVRMYQDTVMSWPAQYEAPHPSPDLVREWDLRLTRAGLDDAVNWNGHAELPRYVRGLFLGGKLEIQHRPHPGVTVNARRRVYYVDSLDYTYSAMGRFTTALGITRGQVSEE